MVFALEGGLQLRVGLGGACLVTRSIGASGLLAARLGALQILSLARRADIGGWSNVREADSGDKRDNEKRAKCCFHPNHR